MSQKLKKYTFLILIVVVFYSCNEWKTPSKDNQSAQYSGIRETEINDSLVFELGLDVQDYIQNQEFDNYLARYDLKRFGELSTSSGKLDASTQIYRKNFVKGFTSNMSFLPKRIYQEIEMGGSYDFLRYYYDPESLSYRMLFRLFSEENGINYHDYLLRKKDGKFYMEDIYVYLGGENLSESMQKLYVASMPPNVFEKVFKKEESENARYLNLAMKAQQKGYFGEVLKYLEKIEGELKNKKIIHVIKINAASQLGDEEYKKAMREMLLELSDDPTAYLLSIDYHIMNGNYEEAISSIDQLEIQTGDLFLNYLRGNIAFEARDYPLAASSFRTIAEEFPDYLNGKTSLMAVYSAQGNYKNCLGLMNNFIRDGVLEIEEMVEYVESSEAEIENIFEPLIESREYSLWKADQLSL